MSKPIFKLFYRKFVFLSLAVVIFLLVSCSNISGNSVMEKTEKNPEVYFCPKNDCSKVFEKNINSANF